MQEKEQFGFSEIYRGNSFEECLGNAVLAKGPADSGHQSIWEQILPQFPLKSKYCFFKSILSSFEIKLFIIPKYINII